MWVDLVRTVTEDGLRLDGVLHAPADGVVNRTAVDGCICLHGVGSSFYGSSLFEALTPSLTAVGLPTLWVNTRGHDNVFAAATRQGRRWLGAAFESVDECRWDVTGWLDWATRAGWQRIGLIGHSLGAIKAVYSQAHAPDERVRRVMALSPPRLSYACFQHDPQGAAFFDAIQTAKQQVAAGKDDALIRVQYPFPLIISAAGYLEKYGPAERYNIVPLVSQVACPLLFVYGQLELDSGSVAFAGVPEALRRAARPGQELDVVAVPGADHNYTRCAAPLAEVLRGWLAAD
ncbi:MAG: hypothetical protein U0935_04580 [Pirellulales bacterium]